MASTVRPPLPDLAPLAPPLRPVHSYLQLRLKPPSAQPNEQTPQYYRSCLPCTLDEYVICSVPGAKIKLPHAKRGSGSVNTPYHLQPLLTPHALNAHARKEWQVIAQRAAQLALLSFPGLCPCPWLADRGLTRGDLSLPHPLGPNACGAQGG